MCHVFWIIQEGFRSGTYSNGELQHAVLILQVIWYLNWVQWTEIICIFLLVLYFPCILTAPEYFFGM